MHRAPSAASVHPFQKVHASSAELMLQPSFTKLPSLLLLVKQTPLVKTWGPRTRTIRKGHFIY